MDMIFLSDDDFRLDIEATSKRIASLIDRSGITDKELSQKLNISIQAVNKWRHGRSLPDIQNAFALARILNVKLDEMMVSKGVGNLLFKQYFFDKASFFKRIKAYKERLVFD